MDRTVKLFVFVVAVLALFVVACGGDQPAAEPGPTAADKAMQEEPAGDAGGGPSTAASDTLAIQIVYKQDTSSCEFLNPGDKVAVIDKDPGKGPHQVLWNVGDLPKGWDTEIIQTGGNGKFDADCPPGSNAVRCGEGTVNSGLAQQAGSFCYTISLGPADGSAERVSCDPEVCIKGQGGGCEPPAAAPAEATDAVQTASAPQDGEIGYCASIGEESAAAE